MVDTFEKFMEKEYYNEIFDALKSYILKNRARLELETNRVPNPQYTELDDFKISNILFSNTPGYEIEFLLVVMLWKENDQRRKETHYSGWSGKRMR